jgi:HTH-type transcriptional regulator, sugar sensing transcriptional regulator
LRCASKYRNIPLLVNNSAAQIELHTGRNHVFWVSFCLILTLRQTILNERDREKRMKKFDEKESLKALTDIGLNLREARIYLNLLTRNDFTATEIAKFAKTSRYVAYELLNKMIRLGICKEKPGKVKRFQAVSPNIALPHLVEYQAEEFGRQAEEFQRDLQNKQNLIMSLNPILEDLYERGRGEDDPLNYFEVLRDRKQVMARFLGLMENTQREIVNFTKPPYIISSPLEENAEIEALKRGISERAIYECAGGLDESLVAEIESMIKYGEKAKVIKSLPLKLNIFDDRISFIAMRDPITGKQSTTTLVVEHKDFALVLGEVFERYWEKAIPFEEYKKQPSLID